jgi:hypothetical protein
LCCRDDVGRTDYANAAFFREWSQIADSGAGISHLIE